MKHNIDEIKDVKNEFKKQREMLTIDEEKKILLKDYVKNITRISTNGLKIKKTLFKRL